MEKELTSAEKARKTKLSNKSIEELVEIVFRKDNIEKKLQRLNKCLKANIIGLENKCNNINDSLDSSEEEVTRLNRLTDSLEEDVQVRDNKIYNLKREIKIINTSYIIGIIIYHIILAFIFKVL